MVKNNYRIVIEYDGSHFYGWQKQACLPTVQEELQRAIQQALHSTEIYPLQASGRTDAGVHARAISNILRHKVSVLSIEKVDDSFHSIHSATARQYRYYIINRAAPPVLNFGFIWHVPKPLDFERLNLDAAFLVGKHDFSSFRGSGCLSKNPVKNVFESYWTIESDSVLGYTIRG